MTRSSREPSVFGVCVRARWPFFQDGLVRAFLAMLLLLVVLRLDAAVPSKDGVPTGVPDVWRRWLSPDKGANDTILPDAAGVNKSLTAGGTTFASVA